MPKQPIDLSDYEENTSEADIKSLKQFLDEMDNCQEPHRYTVIENFPKPGNHNYVPQTYEIINLTMEIEDGIVMCNGYLENEDIMLFDNLLNNGLCCNLNVFLTDNVIMVGMNKETITISFDGGYIQILY